MPNFTSNDIEVITDSIIKELADFSRDTIGKFFSAIEVIEGERNARR